MVKYLVLRGKVSKGDKSYKKGETFESTVKDAENFPRSMIWRVVDTPAPVEPPELPDPEPIKEPESIPEPDPIVEKVTEKEAKPRVTI